MFVVESSTTGAEILCLIVPVGKCLVVMLRWGIGVDICGAFVRLFVKARERDIAADVLLFAARISGLMHLPNEFRDRKYVLVWGE